MKSVETKNQKSARVNRIIFVWNYVEWGGVQTYFLGLMRSVADAYSVKVVLPAGSNRKITNYLTENNIEYEFYTGKIDIGAAVGIRRKLMRRINDVKANYSLARHLSRLNLPQTLVQIDVAPWSGFFLLLYLTWRTNVYVTFHTFLPEFSTVRKTLLKLKFAALKSSGRFHPAASNNDVKKSLRPYLSEADFDQVEIVYSSVNTREIEKINGHAPFRQQVAEQYNLPADKIWVCNVAQFIERKGCRVFIEAVAEIARRRSDLFFFWIGTQKLDADALEHIAGCRIENVFRYFSAEEIGETRADLLELWSAADIFALPSFQEGLPMSLIEAMALGNACIASRVNAIPEAIDHSETGILINPNDVAQLVEAIILLADDEKLRMKLAEKARARAFRDFSEAAIGQKMLALYDAAAQAKN